MLFAVDRVERLFKIYEVQIECCFPLVNLLNDVLQYNLNTCSVPPCLFYNLPGGGGGNSIVSHLSFLTHSVCQYDVT